MCAARRPLSCTRQQVVLYRMFPCKPVFADPGWALRRHATAALLLAQSCTTLVKENLTGNQATLGNLGVRKIASNRAESWRGGIFMIVHLLTHTAHVNMQHTSQPCNSVHRHSQDCTQLLNRCVYIALVALVLHPPQLRKQRAS
jgi:hypothetical protein